MKAHIQWLDKEIKEVELHLASFVNAEDVKSDVQLLTSVPGIGNLTAMYLIAFLPELGHATDKQLAALVGDAPYSHDSGKLRGKRFIFAGRHTIRRALYMAAVASIKWNADLRAFYQRLKMAGKPSKVALIAVIRKIVCLLNTIMNRQTPWIEKELKSTA